MQLKIWLQEQQSAFVEALAALVNQNTFSANTEGVEIGMQMVDMWAAAAGFTTQTINEKHRLVCTEKGTANNRILLVAHMDTVHPADGDFQTYEPLADGFVRGPGTGDIKGGLLMALWAMKALTEFDDNFDVQLIISAEEEIGSPTLREWYTTNAAQADYVICMEPAFPVKGDSIIVGAPTGVVQQRKGCGHVTFSVSGRASHAGGAWELGVNAVEAMAHHILNIQALSDVDRGITTNIGMVNGGTALNIVPDHCEVGVDFRFLRQTDGDETLANIKAIVRQSTVYNETVKQGSTLDTFNIKIFMPPMELTPSSQTMIDIVLEEAQKLGQPVQAINRGGGSDANWISSSGVPTICGMGAPAEAIHTTAEKIHLPTLFDRLELLIHTVRRLK